MNCYGNVPVGTPFLTEQQLLDRLSLTINPLTDEQKQALLRANTEIELTAGKNICYDENNEIPMVVQDATFYQYEFNFNKYYNNDVDTADGDITSLKVGSFSINYSGDGVSTSANQNNYSAVLSDMAYMTLVNNGYLYGGL